MVEGWGFCRKGNMWSAPWYGELRRIGLFFRDSGEIILVDRGGTGTGIPGFVTGYLQ